MNTLITHGLAGDDPKAAESSADGVDDIDAAMRAARVFLAVIAQSVAEVEYRVTSPQLRVLVLIATHGPQNLGAVAADLGVHPSNATRTCDRLVAAGLLDRRDNPADRRYLLLALSAHGKELVDTVMEHRRTAIAAVMNRMPATLRATLGPALEAFAQAAGEIRDDERFALTLKDGPHRDRPGTGS
ncbi:Transcriptional regulator, MarR family [Arthrobacter sp. PAMC 25486]|uniref:MarR family winged helix-turn-helix transcriptional regulator n=1 Tax=Arthrobacter sp. PAMC 25486 TaxID=1494608 RepID=UPI000535A042|nr:MarR family transcriptional regulator [Arthrobacter sp. PAMC 25486]AIY00512.1 Transcriptional regulator, MarR family [Arthrobacter sp. PAMC 25486]